MWPANPTPLNLAHVGSVRTSGTLASLSDIHMLLAPLAEASSSYRSLCRRLASDAYTILDSGALELSEGTSFREFSPQELLDIALDLRVHEVVASDVPHDPKGSLCRTRQFIKLWHRLPQNARLHLMVVPHARTLTKWVKNALSLISEAPLCTVGIPRRVISLLSGSLVDDRVCLAEILRAVVPGTAVHLLGAGPEFLRELIAIGRTSGIRSMDSTFVHRYATLGADPLNEYVRPLSLVSAYVPVGFQRSAQALDKMIRRSIKEGMTHARAM